MSWSIDTVHTHIGFAVKHMMVTTVRGQFRDYRGSINLDASDFTRSSFEGEVDVASIDTGNVDRDNHLRNNDFFDAPNHPKITFKSTKIEPKGEGEYVVTGDLTIRGVTKPVSFDVEYHGTSKNPWGKTVTGLSARATINRKDFGVNFNALLETGGVAVAEKVKIEIDAEAAAGLSGRARPRPCGPFTGNGAGQRASGQGRGARGRRGHRGGEDKPSTQRQRGGLMTVLQRLFP